MFEQAINQVAGLLDISANLVGFCIVLSMALALSVVIFRLTGSLVFAVISSGLVLGFGASLLGFIPMWMVASMGLPVIYLFFRSFWLGKENTESLIPSPGNKRKELASLLETKSKEFSNYTNNLDALLGVKTKVRENRDVVDENSLLLTESNVLEISKYYDWYIVDKSLDIDIFKVVGLAKETEDKNVVFLLGRTGDKSFLTKLPDGYLLGKSCQECIKYKEESEVSSSLLGVVSLTIASSLLSSLQDKYK